MRPSGSKQQQQHTQYVNNDNRYASSTKHNEKQKKRKKSTSSSSSGYQSHIVRLSKQNQQQSAKIGERFSNSYDSSGDYYKSSSSGLTNQHHYENDKYFDKLDCEDPDDNSKLALINFHFGKLSSKKQKKHFFKTRVYIYFLLQSLFFFGIWYFDNKIHRFSHVFLWQFAFISLVLIPIIMSGLYRLKKAVGVNTILTVFINFLFTPFFVYITRTIGESLYFQLTINYATTILVLLIISALFSKSLKYYIIVSLIFISLILQNIILFLAFERFTNVTTIISLFWNFCVLLYITYELENLKYVYNYTEGLTCFVDINIFIFWTFLGKLECILFTFILLAALSIWIFIK